MSLEAVPPVERLAHAIVTLGDYVVTTVCPVGLAIFYPLEPIAWARAIARATQEHATTVA